ncbi:MAG: DUF1080 domain-containing protein [Pirellulaceae bacterium]|jgi:hypothetical protein|nr:DUF1080 domain-containing protein [Pirellulaceae bacterium]MDP7020672.1 DUF1080 domain-containing protein [Pirellulaceae bacterium]
MRRSSPIALFLLTAAFSVALSTPSLAQGNRPVAFHDPGAAGVDFTLQGEYLGQIVDADGLHYEGLQVVARGDGRFDAVQLPGGLPGAGWNRQTRIALQGERDGDRLVLQGEDRQVEVAGGVATVFAGGRSRGSLEQIHRISPTQHAAPPAGASVLFGGQLTDKLKNAKVNDDGLLEVGFITADPVGDFRLHLEFRTPFMPHATGQGRGNSGVYIQQRYEVQVLDSFGLEGVENECGGLYRQKRADVNMAFPPLSWQTYDIYFRAARWDDGKKVAAATITVLHNGVAIHDGYELKNKTGAGKPEGPDPLPILFQNHRDPVHFRNLWIAPLGHVPSDGGNFASSSDAPTICVCPPRGRGLLRRRR